MRIRSLLVLLPFVFAFGAAAQEPRATIKTMWTAGLPEGMPESDEGQGRWAVAVELAAPLSSTVRIKVETAGGTATPGVDYVPLSEVLEFPPGETFKHTYLWVYGDKIGEGPETLVIRATQGGVLLRSLTSTIADDDWNPNVDVSGGSVVETRNEAYVVFRIRLDRWTKVPVSIAYTTVDGTAVAGSDYRAASGTIVIPQGETAYDLRVAVIGDGEVESDETFSLRLFNPSGAVLRKSSAPATILNDDFPPPPFSITSDARREGDAGTKDVDFEVRLGTASSVPVTVTVQSSNGSATAGVDYVAFAETHTFAPGVTRLPLRVRYIGDTLVEPDESFTMSVIEDGVLRASAVFRILDDDRDLAIAISDVSVVETDAIGTAAFEVTLSKASSDVVRVAWTTVAETATMHADFTPAAGELVFPPGTTSRTITVAVPGDFVPEETETFRIDLSNATGGRIVDPSGVCTIADDDGRRRRAARH